MEASFRLKLKQFLLNFMHEALLCNNRLFSADFQRKLRSYLKELWISIENIKNAHANSKMVFSCKTYRNHDDSYCLLSVSINSEIPSLISPRLIV